MFFAILSQENLLEEIHPQRVYVCLNPHPEERKSLISAPLPWGHVIHPSAQVHPSVRMGIDVFIGDHCVVGENVVIGDHCMIGHHTVLRENVVLKNNVVIQNECILYDHVMIHDHSYVGAMSILTSYVKVKDESYLKPGTLQICV